MKTTEMETIYDLGTKMIEALQQAKASAGTSLPSTRPAARSPAWAGPSHAPRTTMPWVRSQTLISESCLRPVMP